MFFCKMNKRDKALAVFESQFGIRVYNNGEVIGEQYEKYAITLLPGYDFIAVLNRYENEKFFSKEWYKFQSEKWIKKASLNFNQSLEVYKDTKPEYINYILKKQNGVLTSEQKNHFSLLICDEYLSSYFTSYYFGFSIKVHSDIFWQRGEFPTEAIYMPYRF